MEKTFEKDQTKFKEERALFDSKINNGFWDEGPVRNRKLLPAENYSTVLGRDFEFLETNKGFDEKYKSQILASYYGSSEQDLAVAQVISKKEREAGELYQLNISTYCAHQGDIILINRFDLKGRAHLCDFSIFSGKEKELFEKYFTDKINNNGAPISTTPHIHFQTKTQAEKLRQPNPISLENLIKYLEDLDAANEDLLQYDLGMPFLDYKLGKKQYTSPFWPLLEKFAEPEENEPAWFVINFLEASLQSPIEKIKNDITFLKQLLYVEDYELLNSIAAFKFISSLLNNNPEEQTKAENELLKKILFESKMMQKFLDTLKPNWDIPQKTFSNLDELFVEEFRLFTKNKLNENSPQEKEKLSKDKQAFEMDYEFEKCKSFENFNEKCRITNKNVKKLTKLEQDRELEL